MDLNYLAENAAEILNFEGFKEVSGSSEEELQYLVKLNLDLKADFEKFSAMAWETFKYRRFERIRPQIILFLKSLYDRKGFCNFAVLDEATELIELNLSLGRTSDEDFLRHLLNLEELEEDLELFIRDLKRNPLLSEILHRFSQNVWIYPYLMAYNFSPSLWENLFDNLEFSLKIKALLSLFKPEFHFASNRSLSLIREYIDKFANSGFSENNWFKLLLLTVEAEMPEVLNTSLWQMMKFFNFNNVGIESSFDLLIEFARAMARTDRIEIFQAILNNNLAVQNAIIDSIGVDNHKITLAEFICTYNFLEDEWKTRVNLDEAFYERIFKHFLVEQVNNEDGKLYLTLICDDVREVEEGESEIDREREREIDRERENEIFVLVFNSNSRDWSKSISDVRSDNVSLMKSILSWRITMSKRNFSPSFLTVAKESKEFRDFMKTTIFKHMEFPIRVTEEVVQLLDNDERRPIKIQLGNISEYLKTVDSDEQIEALMRVTRLNLYGLHKRIANHISSAWRYYEYRYFYGYFIRAGMEMSHRADFIQALRFEFATCPEIFFIDYPDLFCQLTE